MNEENRISGKTEEEVWQQVTEQFKKDPEPLEYTAVIEQENRKIVLEIDIDLGGGFESGYETTTFTAPLHSLPPFRFALHPKHFTDDIGKFFGMEDIEIGFAEFDEKFIIKTNNPPKIKRLFTDTAVRNVFLSLDDFTFGIVMRADGPNDEKSPFLELLVEAGVTDVNKLRSIYSAFFSVLVSVDTL